MTFQKGNTLGVLAKGKHQRKQTIKVADYGIEEVNRLAVVCEMFEVMDDNERRAALNYVTARYLPAPPSEDNREH